MANTGSSPSGSLPTSSTPSAASPTWASFDNSSDASSTSQTLPPPSSQPSQSAASSAPPFSSPSSSSPSSPSASSPTSSPSHAPVTLKPAPAPGTPSIIDGARTIHAQDLLHVHQVPCARDAFLFGLAAGFGIGGLHFVIRGTTRGAGAGGRAASAWRSMNYFVGAWALGSAGAFQFCQRQRELERRGIGRAVEIMERKRREKEEEMRRAREMVRRRRELAAAEEERRRRWWGLGRWLLPKVESVPEPGLGSGPGPESTTGDGGSVGNHVVGAQRRESAPAVEGVEDRSPELPRSRAGSSELPVSER